MNIIVDFDNTIADSDNAILALYREITGDCSTDYSMRSSWWYDDICPLWDRETQSKSFTNPRFFEVLKPFNGAIEVLQYLKDKGHKIVICTAHRPEGVQYKAEWIKQNLPFVDSVIYVDLNYKMDKSMITADFLFDDNVDNLKNANVKFPLCYGDYAWNQDWQGDRVTNWEEVKNIVDAVEEILNGLNKASEMLLHMKEE